jgi:hypothetical protein
MAKKKQTAQVPDLNLSECVSLPAAARLADVSERHMRLLVEAGKVLGVKLGRNWLVSVSSAAAFSRHPSMGRPRSRKSRK